MDQVVPDPVNRPASGGAYPRLMNQPRRETTYPPAATRWLDRALPADAPTPAVIKIEQRGQFDANGRWLSFKAVGTYQARPLSFDWQARLSLLPGVWIAATDGHADGEGWGGSKMWGLKSLGHRQGPDVLVLQVVRNIGELAWLPDLARADPALAWREAGDDAFEISTVAGDREVVVRFDVDDQGDVTCASSPSRSLGGPEGSAEAPWRCDYSDHREFDGVRIPASVVATFDLDEGPWEYCRGEVVSVSRQGGAA